MGLFHNFRLVLLHLVIALICHMALRNLANFPSHIWTTLKTVQAFKSLSLSNIYEFSTMPGDGYATITYVTAPNEDIARQLSSKLVENKLAACVNIVKNVESIYEWKGKIEHDTEMLMVIKSHSTRSAELSEFVRSNHPYDCPEVVTLKVDTGSEPYLKWVREQVDMINTRAAE